MAAFSPFWSRPEVQHVVVESTEPTMWLSVAAALVAVWGIYRLLRAAID
jgi:hypothetical protein